MSGVLLPDVSRSAFDTFRERERWYRLIEVSPDDIEPYDETDRSRIERHEIIVTTTGLETEMDIDPIPTYVNACIEGAAEWGAQFREDFLVSTEAATEDQLMGFNG